MGQKNNSLITNFSSGEISPKMAARIDLAQYQNSCRTILNGIVIPQGGVEKCPGTYYVDEVKDSTQKTYLFPFKYSADQQYALEVGNLYIRFYYNHAQVISSPGVPLEVTTPYLTAEIPDLSIRQSADVLYIAHPNHPPAKLSRTATGWSYDVISFQMGSMPVNNVGAGQAGCVRVTVMKHGLASNNAVYISGVVGVPQANGVFIVNVVDINTFDLIGSSLPGNQILGTATAGGVVLIATTPGFTAITGDLVNVGGVEGTTEANGTWKVTLVNDSQYAIPNYTLDNSAFVNNYVSGGWASLASAYGYVAGGGVTLVQPITGAANNGSGKVRITCVSHGFLTGQSVKIIQVVGTTEANATWEITVIDDDHYDLNGSAFSHSYVSGGYGIPVTFATPNNYPSAVAFFEQRLVWASTINQPQTLWMSATGDFENLIRGSNDDDAIVYTLNSDGINAIRWMATWNVLLLGTVDGEWRFGGATITDPITPTSALAKIQSDKGSAKIKALLIGDLVVFVQYYGKKIYQIGYTFVSDSFKSDELTKLASHITKPGIICMVNQEAPEIIVWMVRSDGVMVPMTFYTDEKIIAFSKRMTKGLFEWATQIRGTTEDEVWVIANRTIGGVTKRYVEYFMPRDFTEGATMKTITTTVNGALVESHVPVRPYPYFFVDSGLSFDGGDPVSITAITQTNPVVVTYSGSDPINGWTVMLENVMDDIEGDVFTVANVGSTAKTFELSGVDGSAFAGYTTDGTWKRVVDSVTNLGHLEGEEVDICVDGYALPPQAVVNGSLALGGYYNRVAAGLHYDYLVEPQSIEINTPFGTSVGITKKIEKLGLRLFQTVGGQVGPDQFTLQDLIFDPQGGLFTGDIPIEFPGDYDTNAFISIKHSQPLPITVLGVITLMTAGER